MDNSVYCCPFPHIDKCHRGEQLPPGLDPACPYALPPTAALRLNPALHLLEAMAIPWVNHAASSMPFIQDRPSLECLLHQPVCQRSSVLQDLAQVLCPLCCLTFTTQEFPLSSLQRTLEFS